MRPERLCRHGCVSCKVVPTPETELQKGGVLTDKKIKKTLRVTEEESQKIAQAVKQQGVSENHYLKMLLMEKPRDFPEFRQMLNDLICEVNHIGNNVNQIARNANGGIYSETEKELLLAYMRKLNELTRKVVTDIGDYKDPEH